ncbi:MAG TPA: C40 family peptidase [Steroidobacteraceae bacterium]|nr:C40 family peptidase [Steroidobacteraceae bacterium]
MRGSCEVRRLRYTAAIVLTLLLVACSSVPRESEPPRDAGSPIARSAAQLVGAPYHFGGADLQGFDCSGLAVYVYERAGVEIPRTAREQQRAARPVALDSLSPGDLVFFRIHSRQVNHVGIYVGGDRFIHAPRSGGTVSYGNISAGYYHKHLVGAGRFWNGEASPTSIPSPH